MKTGWPPGLLQDDDRGLSRWFASRPDARYQLRKNMTKDKIIETLKLAQSALHMATLPFPIDEAKTLTDEEIMDNWLKVMWAVGDRNKLPIPEFARAIEDAHGIKENT